MVTGFVHSTGFAPELLYPGLAAIWGDVYTQHPSVYERFMTMKTSDQRFEKEQGMTGFSQASVKDEGDSVEYARLTQGFQEEYVHITYGLGAIITREMIEDDQYGYIQQIPRLLAEAMRRTEEVVSTSVLNNGFDTSFAGADGQPLFSTGHPNAGSNGGTQRNRPVTPADLTQTSVEQGIIDFMDYRDEQGQRLNYRPNKLVVSRSDWFNGTKILGTEYKVGSADNDINVISDLGMELVYTNYLTDQDAWFLCSDDVPHGLTFYRRRPASIERDNDISTQNLAIITTQRFSVGHTDWRAAYGSPGA